MAASDYPILGPPTLSFDQFAGILRSAGSPAASEASGLWSAATSRGVDPGVFLAIFQHESGFGRAGVAVQSRNPGNLRTADPSFGGVRRSGFEYFPSWTAGANATAALLASGLYGRSAGYNTARKLPFRWAPSSDGNAPSSYGSALVASLNRWTGGKGIGVTAPQPSPRGSVKAPVAAPAVAARPSILPLALLATLAVGGILLLLIVVKVSRPEPIE